MSRRNPEAASGAGNQQRSRVAARLRGSVRVLLGKDGLPQASQSAAPEVQRERRVPRREELERIRLTPNEPTRMHHQGAEVPEHVGVSDRRGNFVMARFELPGREGPLDFCVIRREDGMTPQNAAAGYPESLKANRLSYGAEATTITVMPTELYRSAITEMNDRNIHPNRFAALRWQVQHASVTITAGEEVGIGRDSKAGYVFGDLLSQEASSRHLVIGLTERTPDSGLADAVVYIEDYSANGTEHVTQLPHGVGQI